MLRTLAVSEYRSLRNLVLPLAQLNVITGPNGSGKSSLYRSLRLLAEAASGRLVASLAREGGLQSTFWAGPYVISRAMRQGDRPIQGTVSSKVAALCLGFGTDDLSYAIDLGYAQRPPPNVWMPFALDPDIKRECIWAGPVFRQGTLLIDRRQGHLRARSGARGGWQDVPLELHGFETMMTAFSDPSTVPETLIVRRLLESWRFYDHFRTDPEAPARHAQIGTHTAVLADDGSDLAAALCTIQYIGDSRGLEHALEDAFPGSVLSIDTQGGRFEIALSQKGLLRPLRATELSDGTLRYLLLAAALLSPRPPSLLVLNEPETSLHPSLIAPLGRLIAEASRRSQVIVVSHHTDLVNALESHHAARRFTLAKEFGETVIANAEQDDLYQRWEWPGR